MQNIFSITYSRIIIYVTNTTFFIKIILYFSKTKLQKKKIIPSCIYYFQILRIRLKKKKIDEIDPSLTSFVQSLLTRQVNLETQII